MSRKSFKKTLNDLFFAFFIVLIFGYFSSLLARWSFFADLFSHFTLQYMIGGVILCVFFIVARNWRVAACCALIALLNFGEILFLTRAEALPAKAAVKVMHYNSLAYRDDTDQLEKWIRDNSNDIDVIVLQEAVESDSVMSRWLADIYPHQIHEPRDHAFGIIVLSRHPLSDARVDTTLGNPLILLTIKPQDWSGALKILAAHAMVPIRLHLWRQRNAELAHAAAMLRNDSTPHKIMMGDWNVTPYSPFFKDLLKTSGLSYRQPGPVPVPTWPIGLIPWVMQIPIDHIIASDTLALNSLIRVAPAVSDHYALVAEFSEK